MKKITPRFMACIIAAIVTVLCIVCLCSFKYYPYTPDSTPIGVRVSEIKMNGHYYVVASRINSQSGICIIHSPNCNCTRY